MFLLQSEKRCDELAAQVVTETEKLRRCHQRFNHQLSEVASTPAGLVSSFGAGVVTGLVAPGTSVSRYVARGIKMAVQILLSSQLAEQALEE